MQSKIFISCVFLVMMCALICIQSGCASAVAAGQNNALDSTDLVKMTDQMSASIIGSAMVQKAYSDSGRLKVVVEPVVNQMQAEILRTGEADAFTSRLRALLSHHAPEEFTWIINRDTFYRLRDQELQVTDPGPSPDAVNPDYALTATFTSIAKENNDSRNDYYVCNYLLTNLKDRSVLWAKSYEVQKRVIKGFLD